MKSKCLTRLLSISLAAFMLLLSACKRGDAQQETVPVVLPVAEALTATPLPAPTAEPTAAPEPAVAFTADEALPLPTYNETVAHGKSRKLGGTVTADDPLTEVSIFIGCQYNEDERYPYVATVTFLPESGVHSYCLTDDNTVEGVSLDSLVKFSELGVGAHTLHLSVKTARMAYDKIIAETDFRVLSDSWSRFSESDFSNNSYTTALRFFGGDTDRFLYRYQKVYKRYVIADEAWEKQYIVDFPAVGLEPWRIHTDAVPYYERALGYLNDTYVRVHGACGDSGVIRLSDLIITYHGSYVSRFTSSEKYVSHHGLGTATDINALMPPNENTKANKAVIDDEVRGYLAYNGIQTDGAVSYYDFTYSGSYGITHHDVPETVINYILYELAFYRAGFQWGHYYNSTSDGMHFVLTDNIKIAHDSAEGLRKVFSYCN